MNAEKLPIAVDAMGGDNAPREVVLGVIDAIRLDGERILLVGQREAIERELKDAAFTVKQLDIVEAEEVIEMGEHPANAVRSKKKSSMTIACQQVVNGKAAGMVSAGNSGAVLATALFTNKRIDGIDRPAIGALLPVAKGRKTFLIDSGANTDCKPEWLVQFALMGDVYAKTMMGVEKPRIGLLSNGAETGKGNQQVQATAALMGSQPINFVGNAEPHAIFAGEFDVVVCDGFLGNVLIKTAEGVGEFLLKSIKEAAMSSITGKLGGALLKPKIQGLRDRMDWRHTGGALLMGVNGEVVIAHGRSDRVAVRNAIKVARRAAEQGVSKKLVDAMPAPAPAPLAVVTQINPVPTDEEAANGTV